MTEPQQLDHTENGAPKGCASDESSRLVFENESKKRRAEEESTEKCGTRESGRCLCSNLILILLFVSIVCLGVSLRYQWVQTCCTNQGFVSLGLLKMNVTFVGFETQEKKHL